VESLQRWEKLKVLQEHYPFTGDGFIQFLHDCMHLLGFSASDIQEDIARYMHEGPQSLMVQAQRGQAKTTIAACYCVFDLVHRPAHRVLVISAGGTQASEISTLIVRLILTWEVLECMRPDKLAGDKVSVEAFDIHHSLKGLEKSPSVKCFGIGANMQGSRADILLADDVESSKNSQTAVMRAQLLHLTLDFTSLCMDGRIIWLGTPQSSESIYNTLPGRGVEVRVWPGRYPTNEQLPHYGVALAPLLVERIKRDPSLQSGGGPLGNEGKPTDPTYLGEAVLQRKQNDQGASYFQLQHMLNTRLMDAMRFPLKTERLQVLRLDQSRRVPLTVTPSFTPQGLRSVNVGHLAYRVSVPAAVSSETVVIPTLHMYVDPGAGGMNADETGYAISGFSNANIFLFEVGGVPGGYEEEKLRALAAVANVVTVEKNMGFGAFTEVWTPILRQALPSVGIEDDLVSGQKEARILATLEPIIGRGSLILNDDILDLDWQQAQQRGSRAITYSFLHQVNKLTRDRNSLIHDDRLDAVEGTCRYWQSQLAIDQKDALREAQERAWKEMVKDPLGYGRYGVPKPNSMLGRLLRR
jgi:hypothetical protein